LLAVTIIVSARSSGSIGKTACAIECALSATITQS